MGYFLQVRRVLVHNQDLHATGMYLQYFYSLGKELMIGSFRKGGPLAVTDANLMLGRLIPDYFPKIFGKSEKEPLDNEASRALFEKVAKEINEGQEKELSLDEIVYGCVPCRLYHARIKMLTGICFRFIKVANETMCRPIRALTEARGYATGKHVYVGVSRYKHSPLV
jgi:5-oxoprolinase (ATP-hydrolysing)